MAQDLMADDRFAHAVHTTRQGYDVVDYAALGLKMIPYAKWQSQGVAAVLDISAVNKVSHGHDIVRGRQ